MIPDPLVIELGANDMPPSWCTIRTNDKVTAPDMETEGRLLEFYVDLNPKYPYQHVFINDGYTESDNGKYLLDETGNPAVTLDEVQKLSDDRITFTGTDGWRDRHEERLANL